MCLCRQHAAAPAACWLCCCAGAWLRPRLAPTPPTRPPTIEAQSRRWQRASAAVVGVQALAVDDARSIATLGRERQGSGVVIDADGLVLTIGYLILEAEQVELVPTTSAQVPARVVAYDLATGFGLVQALAPLRIEPAPLGSRRPLARRRAADDRQRRRRRRRQRRRGWCRGAPFSGYWEYHIDGALFTAPPRTDHSGAGLFNARGELVGIGSLVVARRAGPRASRAAAATCSCRSTCSSRSSPNCAAAARRAAAGAPGWA